MNLTPHFTLAELTASSTAARLGLDNTPDASVKAQLQETAQMLERIRTLLDAPITVTSGYRSRAVNAAVGGVTSSDHQQGRAADILCPAYGTPSQIARRLAPQVSVLGIGQLILEGVKGKQWVHVSTRVPDKPSNRVITITDKGTRLGIQELT